MFSHSSQYYPLGSHFLDEREIDYLQNSLGKFNLEDITIGDAGEINKCRVGRLMEDHPGNYPKVVNDDIAKPLLALFQTKKAELFFSKYIDVNNGWGIRRCQFNILEKGYFVGRHLDIDSNPDYEIACVVQLGEEFQGGDFIVYPSKLHKKEDAQHISPKYGSITISFCDKEHEVDKVTDGERTSFVLFVSSYQGKNRQQKL